MAQQDKRTSIIEAAVCVFSRNGYYNSKVSQIAKQAGVADGTIYLYFKNKEDLLIQVFLDTMDSILNRQAEALRGVYNPVDRLRIFTEVHFESVSQSPALAEVITVELRQSSKFMRNTDMKPFGRYLGMIASIIRDGQEQGSFRSDLNPRRVARALFGVLDELGLEWAMDDRRMPIEEAQRHVLGIFLNGLLSQSEVSQPTNEELA